MKLLYVVQRYGAEVAGGAEGHARDFATRMAARGHDVDVLTSCAVSYLDWANHYPPGVEDLGGVRVHRLPVTRPRDQRLFGDLDARVTSPAVIPRWLQEEWMRLQGPWMSELAPWLTSRAREYDLAVFVTYLYFTTWAGLRAVPSGLPTVLHPTAHDESYLYLRLFDRMFTRPDGFAFLSPEEEALVRRRFRVRQPGVVVGVGAEPSPQGDADSFRSRYGIGDRPYLLFVGRFDVAKAADELLAYFIALKERNPGPLALLIVGEAIVEPPEHPDIVVTGFVDDATKQGAFAGASIFVQPSYFESFSIVLLEAWAHGVPALVQGRCDVLAGQARRSGGALPYEGFAEFETAVEMLLSDEALRARLAAAGRSYLDTHYRWDAMLSDYEGFLENVARS
ncbi:MAG TPA: glycosyltransferase family 4 protein [Acidimicrobiia bacterium]|nr:glycosyltransferase family 4 protein [Acidimicrobiia bacterium]